MSSSGAWWTRAPEPAGTPVATADAEPPAVTVVLPDPAPEPRSTPSRPAPSRPAPSRATLRRAGRPGRPGRGLPDGRRLPDGRLLALTAVTATLAGAGIGVALLRPERPSPPLTAAAAVTAPVDAARVSATASSTQAPDGDISYGAANTLDGDPATAWNSDGETAGNGPGITLTYTFAEAVDLRGVTVRNGYQKVRRRSGRPPVDLYPVNERVRRLRVVTDAGRWTWDLADTRAPQTFSGATGRTRSVRLEIVTVYPSTTYPDVALSEVSFSAARPGPAS